MKKNSLCVCVCVCLCQGQRSKVKQTSIFGIREHRSIHKNQFFLHELIVNPRTSIVNMCWYHGIGIDRSC
jgi:hypothetical protein